MNNCSNLNFNMKNNIYDSSGDFDESMLLQSKAMGFYNETKFSNEDCQSLLSDMDGTALPILEIHSECDSSVKCDEEPIQRRSAKRTKSVSPKSQDCNGSSSNSSPSKHTRTPVANKMSRETKPHKCPDCNYSGHTLVLLKRHQLSHLVVQKLKCSFCEYSTSFNSKLKEHLVIHSDQRPFKCSKCNFASKLKSNLNKHEKTHLKIYKCSKCEFITDFKSLIRDHKKAHTA